MGKSGVQNGAIQCPETALMSCLHSNDTACTCKLIFNHQHGHSNYNSEVYNPQHAAQSCTDKIYESSLTSTAYNGGLPHFPDGMFLLGYLFIKFSCKAHTFQMFAYYTDQNGTCIMIYQCYFSQCNSDFYFVTIVRF